MTDPNLCFDIWTVHQIASDDFGQDNWDNDDSVNYYQVPEDSDGNEENGRAIQYFNSEDDLLNDIKGFASQMLSGFFSLAF